MHGLQQDQNVFAAGPGLALPPKGRARVGEETELATGSLQLLAPQRGPRK